MSDVEFNEEDRSGGSVLYSRFEKSKKEPKMVAWMIKRRIVKRESQANIILVILALICLIIAIFLYFRLATGSYKNNVLYKEDIPANQISNYPPGYVENLPSRNP